MKEYNGVRNSLIAWYGTLRAFTIAILVLKLPTSVFNVVLCFAAAPVLLVVLVLMLTLI